MKTNSIRQLSLWIAFSVLAVFGMNACGDDSSNSAKDNSKECTEAKITECTNDGKVCKDGECVKDKTDPCTQEKINECETEGKVCKEGNCVKKETDPCTQEKINECESEGKVCKDGECVKEETVPCTQEKIDECESEGKVCKEGNCVKEETDPCTQEKIDECDSQNKICDNGQCVKRPVLTVTPENAIPLVAYNLSMNEEDAIIPASYQFCYNLDTAPSSEVNLVFEKMGPNKDYVGIEPQTLKLNAENYNAATNCITVSDLCDGTPDQIQPDSISTVQIEATTMSDQDLFSGLHADIVVKLQDSYQYDLQLSQTEIELNEEDEPDFDIHVRLLAAPEDENKSVKVNHEISCGENSNITIAYKGINKYHTEDNTNNLYNKTNEDILWSKFKTFKFQLKSNSTQNQPEEACTITFTTETDDPNFKDISKVVNVTIHDDSH